ncbi:MAG: Ig domain-containing protein, partial [Bacteroidales bacterium]|nr:Ig domain-containing protein [Bacteroidales bacterium]
MKRQRLITFLTLSILACACQKEIQPIPVSSVELDMTSMVLTEGDSQELVASISPNNADNQRISWRSSDESIALACDGKIIALKPGSAMVTVTTEDGGKTASCSVTVEAKFYPVEKVTLNITSLEIVEGGSYTLSASITPENATNKKIFWSSSNEAIATVVDGIVSALKPGEVEIIATTEDSNKTATCKIAVLAKEYPVESISLNQTTAEVTEGESITLSAQIQPENAT